MANGGDTVWTSEYPLPKVSRAESEERARGRRIDHLDACRLLGQEDVATAYSIHGDRRTRLQVDGAID